MRNARFPVESVRIARGGLGTAAALGYDRLASTRYGVRSVRAALASSP
jgi:hypothetical protein